MTLIRRACWLVLVALVCAMSASAITVDQLIDSYDYDFYDGTVNVTNATDAMRDLDSDGVNATLVINVTTDTAGLGTVPRQESTV